MMSSKLNLLRLTANEPPASLLSNDFALSGAAIPQAPAAPVLAPVETPSRDLLDADHLPVMLDPPVARKPESEPRAEREALTKRQPIEDRAAHDDAVRLAARLRATLGDEERTLLFTGVGRTDAANRVAAETALALAMLHIGEVALIDAERDAPALHLIFDLPASPGFADALAGSAAPEKCLRIATANLALMPGGTRAEGVAPSCAGAEWLLRDLRSRFRFVVISAAPLLSSADSALLAAASDGAVIVLTRGHDDRDALARTKRELDGLRCRTLGAVLCEEPPRSLLRHRRNHTW